jgi:hypothetical protein
MTTSGSFELIRSGFIVTEGFGRMLVTTCDPSLSCRMSWLDSTTFEPLSELAVPGDSAQWGAFLLANGRVIGTNPTDFIDVENGEGIRIQASEMDGLWRGSTAISPDARVLISAGATTHVRGLRTGVVRELDNAGVPSVFTPVFIPKEAGEAP